VAAEASRKHSRGLDGRRNRQRVDRCERPDWDPPAPAVAFRIVLGIADDLHHGEDRLPPRGVAEGEISFLEARPSRGGVRAQRADVNAIRKGTVTRSANQQPVLKHLGFLTSRQYPRRIRTFVSIGLAVAAIVVASGCGESAKEATPGANTTTTAETTTTTATTSGIDPLEGAGTGPVVAQTSSKGIALLERVAVGRHEGYDRVVFQFREDLPGYRIEYVEPPLKEDGSGNPVRIRGNAFVFVRMEAASGFDLNTGEGVIVYKGPRRIDGSAVGTSEVQELVRTGDFEAVLSWVVGLQDKVDFRVRTASSPARLIVDFRNH
jgi:hypothetical protein